MACLPQRPSDDPSLKQSAEATTCCQWGDELPLDSGFAMTGNGNAKACADQCRRRRVGFVLMGVFAAQLEIGWVGLLLARGRLLDHVRQFMGQKTAA